MKLTVGGYRGEKLPRGLNPLVFLGVAILLSIMTVICAITAALAIVFIPLSPLLIIRKTNS